MRPGRAPFVPQVTRKRGPLAPAIRRRFDEPAPGAPAETRRERHVRMLTSVRDHLRAATIALSGLRTAAAPVLCRLHGVPWTECRECSGSTEAKR